MIGADDFRLLLGHFASGVTVVTARDSQGRPAGLTASAFTSVSLNPPLILVCVAQDAQSYEALRGADRFAVNILDRGQQPPTAGVGQAMPRNRGGGGAAPGREGQGRDATGYRAGFIELARKTQGLKHHEG